MSQEPVYNIAARAAHVVIDVASAWDSDSLTNVLRVGVESLQDEGLIPEGDSGRINAMPLVAASAILIRFLVSDLVERTGEDEAAVILRLRESADRAG